MKCKNLMLLVLSLAFCTSSFSQDAYHLWLQNYLKTNFNLPDAQSWILPNTEAGTQNITINYGGTTQMSTSTGTNFTQVTTRTVNTGANPWDAGFQIKNKVAISQGDQCLMAIWLRVKDGVHTFNFFTENTTTYDKETIAQITPTTEWQLFLLPFKATKAYGVDGVQMGLHLATGNLTLEIAGTAMLNYKVTTPFNQLPTKLNLPLYDGAAIDAPWRVQAALDIQNNRKSDAKFLIHNNDADKTYQVHLEMLQHDFKFGSAVVSNLFNNNNSNASYEDKMINMDGKGHGFNEVVFENDLKWPAWEQHWLSPQAQILEDISWLKSKDISIRGHNLMWPGWSYSPSDINSGSTPTFVRNRVINHIKAILASSSIGDKCSEWDVINEITTNNDYADLFKGKDGYVTGREFYAEVFKLAKQMIPNSKLYLNDYIALEQADSPSNGIVKWQSLINEIIAGGGPIEGIGLQGHFSSSPTGIPRAKAVLDDFWDKYHLPMKITEYDISNLLSPEIQAKYMNDILTICYAHPGMEGFITWGFWDGAHWLGNAPIYNKDWSLKPSGQVFVDKIFKEWWTDTTFNAKVDEPVIVNGFKGKYRITIKDNDRLVAAFDTVLIGKLDLEIADLQSATYEENLALFEVWPNPVSDKLHLNLATNISILNIYDNQGKLIKTWRNLEQGYHVLPIDDLKASGIYQIYGDNGKNQSKSIRIIKVE